MIVLATAATDAAIVAQRDILAAMRNRPDSAVLKHQLAERAEGVPEGTVMSLEQAQRIWRRLCAEQAWELRGMLQDHPDARMGTH